MVAQERLLGGLIDLVRSMWVFARARAKLSPSTSDYGQAVGSKLPSLTTVALVQTRYTIVYVRPSHSRQGATDDPSNQQGKPWGVGTRLVLPGNPGLRRWAGFPTLSGFLGG